MSVSAIINQPATNAIQAAYRPIAIRVTDSTSPVVYCDIYFDGIYYKTLSKTQYTAVGEWEFDIQDAVQEYLGKFIEENGEQSIVEVPVLITRIYCKFRGSEFDDEGLIDPDGTIPIQGTDEDDPVPGSGLQSNYFYGINAVLQHEDNQNLATHLNSYKEGVWASTTYPLTHRSNGYKICDEDSDSFPILSEDEPTGLAIEYTLKDGTSGSDDVDLPCIPVEISGSLPDITVGEVYSYIISLTGTSPFALNTIVKPTWMTIAVVGSTIVFSGTPLEANVDEDVVVSFNVTNCTSDTASFSDTIDVIAEPEVCEAVTIDPDPPGFPDAQAGEAYFHSLNLLGTPPFNIISTTYPSWMTVTHIGSTVEFTGTPSYTNIGENKIIDLTVFNCSDTHTARIFDTIDVSMAGKEVLFIRMTPISGVIKIKDNATGIITDITGGSKAVFLTTGAFTLQQISAGNSDLRCYTVWGGSVIQLFDEASQGDVLTITDLPNTNYIGIFD